MTSLRQEDLEELRNRRTDVELDAAEFARVGHALVDRVTELLATMASRPLTTGESPAEIRALLEAERPLAEEGMEAEALLRGATDLLFDHSLHTGHPRFFGYISSPAGPLGILGDMLAAAVNANVGAWVLSPMAAEMEGQAVRWIADLLGYPQPCGGVMVSGGNTANILGFFAARAARSGWDIRHKGMQDDEAARLTVYASRETHTWIHKATDLSGLGMDTVRWIPTDDHQRLDIEALRETIDADVEAGFRPFLVVGTAGSVSTGAVDPLPLLRALCDEKGLWFHVDGAYGGFAVAAEELVPDELLALRTADSLAIDPHKWLYAPLEAGCTLVKDPGALPAAFSNRPEYYHFGTDGTNYFEHGIQNSRGFRALKVWLQLAQVGRAGYARAIAQDILLARRFFELAAEHDELEPVTQGLSITTYRYVPADLALRTDEEAVAAYLNELNEAIQDRMEQGGEAFVSNAVVDGRYALRMCVVNFRTRLEDVEILAELSVRLGRDADAEMRPQPLR